MALCRASSLIPENGSHPWVERAALAPSGMRSHPRVTGPSTVISRSHEDWRHGNPAYLPPTGVRPDAFGSAAPGLREPSAPGPAISAELRLVLSSVISPLGRPHASVSGSDPSRPLTCSRNRPAAGAPVSAGLAAACRPRQGGRVAGGGSLGRRARRRRTQSVSYRAAFVLAAILTCCGHSAARPGRASWLSAHGPA